MEKAGMIAFIREENRRKLCEITVVGREVLG